MSEFNKQSLTLVINDLFKELLLNSPLSRPYQKCAVVPLDLSGLKITEYKMKYGAPTPDLVDRIVARCVVTPNLVLRVTWEQQYSGYYWQAKPTKTATGFSRYVIELEPTITSSKNTKLNGFNAIKRDFSVIVSGIYTNVDTSVAELVQYLTSNDVYTKIENLISNCENKSANMLKIIAPFT